MKEKPFNNDYTDLYKIGEEKFNSWFKQNSIHFIVNKEEDIYPSIELSNVLSQKKYNPAPSQCHYNSQMASLLHDELALCTGLLINIDNEFYTHSFCIFKNQVVDFSARFFIEGDIYGFKINKFPLKYYGVKLCSEFLKKNKKEILENGYSTKPYLYKWYLETN